VPEGVEVEVHGVVVFGHNGVNGNDPPPRPGTPLVRVVALSGFAGSMSGACRRWSHKPLRDVIRGSASRPQGARRVIGEFREQITAVDGELLDAVNRRIELVRRLHDHKVAEGLPLRDPEREDSLVRELQEQNGGPLSDDGVAALFRFLLDLTRKELHGA